MTIKITDKDLGKVTFEAKDVSFIDFEVPVAELSMGVNVLGKPDGLFLHPSKPEEVKAMLHAIADAWQPTKQP